MITVYSEADEDACRQLWEQCVAPELLTDLWEVRTCFHRHFNRKVLFVVAKEASQVVGLLPLCYLEELGRYGYFPGEVWDGKTWLEQNRLIARDEMTLQKMLDWLGENNIKYHLRYLKKPLHLSTERIDEDEIGYLFHPGAVHFNIDEYYSLFSRKKIKAIRKEVDKMVENGITVRSNDLNDFEHMVTLNIERFGAQSYFANNQFVGSFRSLRDYLDKKGWLRMTAILMGGRIAAVDMGCLYNGVYTLLAGGTHEDYPGIAKAINLYHMQEACRQRYDEVDFLCGDFAWKKIFHLTPRPLYVLSNTNTTMNKTPTVLSGKGECV